MLEDIMIDEDEMLKRNIFVSITFFGLLCSGETRKCIDRSQSKAFIKAELLNISKTDLRKYQNREAACRGVARAFGRVSVINNFIIQFDKNTDGLKDCSSMIESLKTECDSGAPVFGAKVSASEAQDSTVEMLNTILVKTSQCFKNAAAIY